MDIEDIKDAVAAGCLRLMGLLSALLLVAGPLYLFVYATAEADCLAKGYPKAAVTWNLHRYCMNLEGTVTVQLLSHLDLHGGPV